MKKPFKRAFALLLCLLCLFPLSACEKQPERLTMFVGLGLTNSGYYTALHDLILEKTGIDVQYVYAATGDMSSNILDRMAHQDLPADIVITAAPTPAALQASVFLDLSAYSNVPDLFSVVTLQGLDVDGGIYQLPFASRLIGIEYNRTLFEEMGWQVPDTMAEMVELKALAEAAGYKFAVSGGVATGHGMNYLLNVMGSQYLATPDGNEWLSDFQAGTASVDAFAEQAVYFERYVEAGLMGSFHTADWNAKTEFSRERALFYYNIVNDISSYDGYRYNADGSIYGADIGEDGLPVAVESETGEAVLLNGAYVLYDPSSEAHQGLTRYTIPGAQVLHDTYASMPWVSEDGSGNCFILYNNMYLALDKALGEKGSEKKLSMAVQVLELLATEDATALHAALMPDGYVGVKGFIGGDDRMYAAYGDQIAFGYLMPWFYSKFDIDSIINTGEKVNEYIAGGSGVTLTDVLDTMVLYNEKQLSGTVDTVATVTKTLDYRESAGLHAIVNGQSLQAVLDAAGENVEITASLLPYMEKMGDISGEYSLPLVQAKFYQGEVRDSTLSMYINGKTQKPVAVRMTGEELEQLVNSGYSSLANYGYDHVFPYVLVLKGGGKLSDSQEYYVAVPAACLDSGFYGQLCDEGRVLLNESGAAYTGDTVAGLRDFFSRNPTVSPQSVVWN